MKHTEESKNNISSNHWAKTDPVGQLAHAKRARAAADTKLQSAAVKEKRAVSVKKSWIKNIVECPHCGKQGESRSMKRYHFANCVYSV